jgi:glycosyltransferase involved in cell wall biosynthesis
LEDVTRIERGISSDSPAASKKVFEMAYALRSAGEKAVILSMGRGKPKRRISFYKAKTVRMRGVLVVYVPFSDIPFISQLLSLISMPYFLYLLSSSSEKNYAVFYNRSSAYITSLFMSVILGIERILELEDAENIFTGNWSPHQFYLRGKRFIYNRLCTNGTLLACRAIGNNIKSHSGLCYYGAVENFRPVNSWASKETYKFLLGGSVSRDTGADILIDAIHLLRKSPEEWSNKLEFIITGKGDCIEQFKTLGKIETPPFVDVAGRLTDIDYIKLVESCDVGMALKPNMGWLADTTFPSKVIELASAGLLVLTTNISDVKLVMGNGAVYLNRDDPLALIDCLRWIVENPQRAAKTATDGNLSVRSHCSMEMAGLKLSNYIFRSKK